MPTCLAPCCGVANMPTAAPAQSAAPKAAASSVEVTVTGIQHVGEHLHEGRVARTAAGQADLADGKAVAQGFDMGAMIEDDAFQHRLQHVAAIVPAMQAEESCRWRRRHRASRTDRDETGWSKALAARRRSRAPAVRGSIRHRPRPCPARRGRTCRETSRSWRSRPARSPCCSSGPASMALRQNQRRIDARLRRDDFVDANRCRRRWRARRAHGRPCQAPRRSRRAGRRRPAFPCGKAGQLRRLRR